MVITDDQGGTQNGKWELSSDEKTLTFDKGTADEAVVTVTSLTATNMDWMVETVEDDIFEMKFVIKLKKV